MFTGRAGAKLVIFAHNFVIYFGVLWYFQIWPGAVALLAVPGLLLVLLNGAAVTLLIGMVSARFRDIPQLINSIVQIVFFVTPIMWKPELLRTRSYIAEFNPFYHLVEIVRAPLLGQMPSCQHLSGGPTDHAYQPHGRRCVLCAISFAHFLLGLRPMTISATHSVEHSELSLDNVSVSFPIYHGGSRSLKKSLLFRGSGGQLASDASHRITVEALRNVSMEFRTGDRVALVGKNGAGKTTLLRVMAGIYEPVTGVVKSRGRISPMFDISLGIDGEISGYDNIRLRGLILGLPAREIEERMADIAEFTELGDYLDIPVRTYSSGMMTRLTFAVATCFSPEILLMDEWILAGDAGFLAKAQHRVEAFVEQAGILVLASHSTEICRRWCNKAVWMERGEVKMAADISAVLDSYNSAAVA